MLVLVGLPVGAACGRHQQTPAPAKEQHSSPKPSEAASPSPPPKDPDGLDPALAAHIEHLRARFDPRGWTVVAEPPFAVVGDGTRLQVRGHAMTTIRWAVTQLQAAYFERPPGEIITIYLFETGESYDQHARELFGDPPDTPYGYYSPSDRALVMNIGTGGGTLVHEIVHPYMATNFPDCPSWFDEGLASLYEQSAEIDGEIMGLTNWRLPGLQAALRAKQVPSFQDMCESGGGFYTADPGSNYAQARYLCYWLQERGLLRRYYQEFRAGVQRDPHGYDTLVAMVGPDMSAFRSEWEQFVLALRVG
ncbi:glycogen branching enzyme [Enhygromyxa salina]|uniref:Glycogen branching enzyme n=2 Tax=Enhygromyxa salina TaxID=215803 RepID=A0A0C2D1Q4_9BACT|nr:glycogen branching enzyme [Enhygromyxa salina]